MATYSFKSVGKTQSQVKNESVKKTIMPYGIKTPMQLGITEGIFAMNYSIEAQFSDNLRNLLLTNWGERVGLYQFGANLKGLTTEFASQDDFDSEAIVRIKEAVEKWMPFIELENFSSEIDRMQIKNTAVVKLNITYNIPLINVSGKGIQIILYVI